MFSSKDKFSKMSINFNYNYPQLAREAGFRLRQYKDGPLDWRLLGSFEIERLMREQNLEDIDRVLVHLSEAPLGSALIETNILDSGIAKFFIVSQFAIQYLLFCRNFLDETVQELREAHAESQVEIARLKKLLNESNNEILQLHKKMTQMEAIHEVIYPCHLCPKNFANNEALNIHIGRKHGNHGNNTVNNRSSKIESPQKEKLKDTTLINTIKLELEIKQLKERLNNAEKEIKERNNISPSASTVEQRNVAIQSNLSEEKEKNEAKADVVKESRCLAERQTELTNLQMKIYEIEEWRATQMINNEDSIAEIKLKLIEISQALERATATQQFETTSIEHETNLHEYAVKSLERRLSVENLERVLSEKVAEIGKASTDKLAEIVHNMEANYRDKLFELEREVKQAAQKQIPSKPIELQPAPRIKSAAAINQTTNVEAQILQLTKSNHDDDDDDDETGAGTYNIELKVAKAADRIDEVVVEEKLQQHIKTNTAGQHIFVEVLKNKPKVNLQTKSLMDNESDTSNVSESLSEDDEFIEDATQFIKPSVEALKLKALEEESANYDKKPALTKTPKIKRPKSPKKFTRRDAKEMAAKQLGKYGFDMRMKSMPCSSFKRINTELQEKRNKLKQTYPNFYATRNRIKKFVDKLCSTKLPKSEKLLIKKPALQPIKAPRGLTKQTKEEAVTTEESEEHTNDNESDKHENLTTQKNDFKKRLERLLASPVQRPLSKDSLSQERNLNPKPLPVPRKRVMFDTAANVSNEM